MDGPAGTARAEAWGGRARGCAGVCKRLPGGGFDQRRGTKVKEVGSVRKKDLGPTCGQVAPFEHRVLKMFSSIRTSSRPFKISTENSIPFVESLPIDENFCFTEHLCA